jgi:hypothetical protein
MLSKSRKCIRSRIGSIVFNGQRKLNDLRLPVRLFPRCVVRQFQKEQPFIRPKRPQGELWRPIARLDETRIFYLFDVFVVFPFQCVESQLRLLILYFERAGVKAHLNLLSGKPLLSVEAPSAKADIP